MKLQIIIGSTRPQRVSHLLAPWAANEAKNLPDTEVEIVDLLDYNLPFLDEPISPQYNPDRKPNAAAKKFLNKVAEADAYVLITPEYNRSYAPALGNALDYIDFQLKQKPVALLAHGSTGGAQAVSHLRGLLPGLLAISVPSATYFMGQVGQAIDEQGNLSEELKSNPYGPQNALKNMLADTKWYSDALSVARAKN